MLVNGDINDDIYFLPYLYDANGSVDTTGTVGITLADYNSAINSNIGSNSDISFNHIQITSGTTTDQNYSMVLSASNDSENTGYIQCLDTVSSTTSSIKPGDLNINSLGGTLTIGSSTTNSDTYINGILSVTDATTLESTLYVSCLLYTSPSPRD